MGFDLTPVFQIAGVGFIIAIIQTVLKASGKEDIAQWATLVGFIIVLFMVAHYLGDLFTEVKRVFLFN
ncbi:stage III sporulation protein AC [Brevibacillus halotolerans]|uniref:stage III sporulation protein AC n=1 Tax=Brevibacillus TaxID=55080 RepID=UPI00215C9320|nr:stage III sporulation protein AC [Brevibacillus laterosporus]MCR8964992.1 stage III sporulation protein AC [Brevibacillus laterosporus]MCZ0837147.1 stage III sporulation protein AC [Brevibacillus halotolerans]